MWYNNEFQIHTAELSEDQISLSDFMSLPGWKPLERCTALCNRAEFEAGEEDKPILKREVHGDASEAALLKCAELSLKDVMAFRAKHKKVAEIPFNSVNKYQV